MNAGLLGSHCGRFAAALLQVLSIGKLRHKKFDLIADPRVAVDQNHILPSETTATASRAVAGFAQKLFRPHLDIAATRADDQLLKTGFLFVLGRSHEDERADYP